MKGSHVILEKVGLALLVLVLALSALTGRVILDGEDELQQSDRAFDKGDLRDSILHARRAAVLYAPGAPHVSAAYARLGAIAVGAESAGDSAAAIAAWGAIRSAALETRHFTTPRAADLERANANLARLQAADSHGTVDRSRLVASLAEDESPRAPWVIVLALGFLLSAAGLGWGIHRGGSISAGDSRKRLLAPGVVALLGVACWTLAVYRA